MASRYCELADVYAVLSAQAFVTRPRPVEAVDMATGFIRLTAHGVDERDAMIATVTSGGSLATGLSEFALYTPTSGGSDLLRLAPVGGSTITSFASAGSGWSLRVDQERRILRLAEFMSSEIDDNLTAQAPPILVDPLTGKYPPILVGVSARMTARAAITSLQIENQMFAKAVDRLFAQEKRDDARLQNWLEGRAILPKVTDQTETTDNSAMAGNLGGPATPWVSGAM